MVNLSSRAVINEYSELDIQYNVPTGSSKTDIVGKLFVNAMNNIQSYANILELWTGLPSSAFINYASYLSSFGMIPDYNSLDILLNVVQPPILDHVLETEKDAFTRQSTPNINYGNRQLLSAGVDYDGEYRTYIHFNLESLQELLDKTVRDVYLIIMKSSGSATFTLHECRPDWYENYITWNTPMDIGEPILTFESKSNENFIIINLRDLIFEKMASGATYLSLALIATSGYLLMSSKESGAGPRLYITYSDPTWVGFVDNINKFNNAIIHRHEAHDYKGAALITKKLYRYCKTLVRRPEYLDSRAAIINNQIPSRAFIIKSIYGTGKAFIQKKSQITGRGYIAERVLKSKGMLYSTTYFSNMAFINYDNADHDKVSKAGVIRKYINALAQLKETINLFSRASIIVKERIDSNWLADILNFTLNNSAIITNYYNLGSKANIASAQDLIGLARITKCNLESISHLLNTTDIGAGGDIKQISDLSSKMSIVKSNIDSIADIQFTKDLQSLSIIKRLNDFDFQSSASIINSYLESKAGIKFLQNISAMASVIRQASQDCESFAEVYRFIKQGRAVIDKTADIQSNALLYETSNITSVAKIINTHLINKAVLYEVSDMLSKSNLYSVIFSQGNAFISTIVNFLSQAIILQYNQDDQLSEAFIQYSTYYNSKGIIVNPSLNCIGYILNARRWRPNYEGGLIFEDMRLPRIWIP